MVGYDRRAECSKAARAIALEAEAIPYCDCTDHYSAAHPNLDNTLLAYSIGADRVRTGAVPFGWDELMPAIEHVIDDAWSADRHPLAMSA
ncbi:hypothetical protein SAMN04515647_2888 [Cohaesibacter sp. ES.047]|uniref:hypothetical protein n=1 Tax=Cohaesibacter sp. ES.047 TaxID=1798205 RepID=UPI000BB746F3|nr:hypothetical protein [Cohaesibacter sp. ES.047]SNY92617.1 hypothetical protein SAMN04515647_2888 [Cohaesibacter sp. ES.047]